MIRNRERVLIGVALALTFGLSGCVIPRNRFPLKEADGPRIPIALLPVSETNVGGFHTGGGNGFPTNRLVRVANRVLDSIASPKNNLIGPTEALGDRDLLSARYVIKTRVVHMGSQPDVSIAHWSMEVGKVQRVRIEMQLLERTSGVVVAESDATEPYEQHTQMLLVFPIGYVGETLGRAADRAARRALLPLFYPAVSNAVSRASSDR